MVDEIEIHFEGQTVTGLVDFDFFPGEKGLRTVDGQMTPDLGSELKINEFIAKEFDTSNMRVLRKGNEDKFELIDEICMKKIEDSPEDFLNIDRDEDYSDDYRDRYR